MAVEILSLNNALLSEKMKSYKDKLASHVEASSEKLKENL